MVWVLSARFAERAKSATGDPAAGDLLYDRAADLHNCQTCFAGLRVVGGLVPQGRREVNAFGKVGKLRAPGGEFRRPTSGEALQEKTTDGMVLAGVDSSGTTTMSLVKTRVVESNVTLARRKASLQARKGPAWKLKSQIH